MCLPRAPALRQVLEAVLAEGALESPSILVLTFHSSLSFVEGSSDGLAASVRSLSPGRLCLTHSVRVEHMSDLTLGVCFSCSSGPDGGFLSDPVAPFLEETIEVPMWVGSFSSLSGSSTVDFFPVFRRSFSPGVVMAPSLGFRLRRSGRLVASGSAELDSTQSFHSVCSLRHILSFVRCELGSPLVPSPSCGTSWLVPSGLAIFASIPLVSRPWTVLSWSPLLSLSSVSDCLVVVLCQLVGLGECSPASPNCPTSRVRKQRSFGFSR